MINMARWLSSRLLSHKSRAALKTFANRVLDGIDSLSGRDAMMPPRSMRFVGHGDFRRTGEEFLQHFVRVGGLRPEHRVLDVGSGIGRMAIPLTRFLSAEGSYDGIEIVPAGVAWCRAHITPRHPNFRFHEIDVYNLEYNPSGRQKAEEYRFPFADNSFDFTFLTSVFTHMLPHDVANYVSEIGRVTRPGGRCLATFFVLNESSRAGIEKGGLVLDFRYEGPGYLTVDKAMPECAIAFPEENVIELFRKNGFRLASPHYGSWCGRGDALSYQDILVFEKTL